ncbi:tryptophan halogenase family protein [Aquabacterium sp. OR-4]|uniref:tryptophan halogenase family protein n=1 Tax=Aquabacterium sp. OR-4 TaxID=2978127 RepID=UPI0028C626D5|nr:tryptophan halogenase family protein [Aquabacterium sp. OR-4]MDT7834208.1 tryptophan halogenase family protein [Aquabacterium sp. OR-4]
MQDERAVREVVVVGGGSAGWMVAAALAQVLEGRVRIQLVESDEIGTVGVGEATIPQMRLFNGALGIDEHEFLRATQGTYKLGIEFVDWGQRGERYLHSFGSVGQDLGLVPFHHYWLKMQRQGGARPLGHYCLNTVAALAARFAPQARAPGLPTLDTAYAYHFDAGLYARYLRHYSEARGVLRTEGRIADVQLRAGDGHVQALQLADGRRIEGELFIDCSGFAGLLIERALHTGYDDWSHWLPCDRAVAVPCEHRAAPQPYTRASARGAGWQWRIPLQHRIGNGQVFSSRHLSEDEATAQLLATLDGPALAEPRALRFVTGKRRKLWHRNVVAVGLASGFLEPLESTSLYLVQASISRLLQFFPTRDFEPLNTAEHNRQADAEFERVRDFIILHYHLTRRDDTPFWNHVRTMEVPDSLREKLALFGATGRLFRAPQDIFSEPSWLQVAVGQGLVPQAHQPLADVLSHDEVAFFLGNIEQGVARHAAAMPLHADYLAAHCRAA